MTKRILTVALGVAIVATMVAPAAFASNMGFKLEREFDTVDPVLSKGLYYVSFPFFRSFEDLGQTTAGSIQTPDNFVTAADVLLDWFTNGDGCCPGEDAVDCPPNGDNGNNFPDECAVEMSLINRIPDPAVNPDQTPVILKIKPGLLGGIIFEGEDFNISEDPTLQDPSLPASRTDEVIRGYEVLAAAGNAPSVIVGSHNPDISLWTVPFYPLPSQNFQAFSLPYHTTYTTADELLTAAFNDADTPPDTEEFTLITFDPDPTTNPDQVATVRKIKKDFLGNIIFEGTNFDLVPGNGYGLLNAAAGPDGVIEIPLPHY